MKLRIGNMVNKQLWFIVCVSLIGAGLIYFLNSIGVIEAMRNDNTLDYLYEVNVKLPKAPNEEKLFTLVHSSGNKDAELSAAAALRAQEIARIEKLLQEGTSSKSAIIPHIIHQTWDSYHVPYSFVEKIKSWINLNPSWEYWFWTEDAVKCFIDKYYPERSVLYEAYPDATSKADAMRYFVLHKFGGFYADLDTMCLKPLDVWANNFCCLLSEEPYEHSYIIRENNRSNIVNSPMGCEKDHEIFKMAIDLLPEYAGKYFGDYLHSTGPFFLEDVFKMYQKRMVSSTNSGDKTCDIVTVPPKYFLPRYDPGQTEIIDGRCAIKSYKTLPLAQMKVCEQLVRRHYKNSALPESFMDHDWIHVNLMGPDWKTANTVYLFDIVPKAKNLVDMFCKS